MIMYHFVDAHGAQSEKIANQLFETISLENSLGSWNAMLQMINFLWIGHDSFLKQYIFVSSLQANIPCAAGAMQFYS